MPNAAIPTSKPVRRQNEAAWKAKGKCGQLGTKPARTGSRGSRPVLIFAPAGFNIGTKEL